MRAAQDIVVGRNDQAPLHASLCLGLVQAVHLVQALDVGQLKVIDAVLHLGPPVDVAVGVRAVPVDVPHGPHLLQVHDDALQAVGQLHRHGVQVQPTGLLEIGVLADLLAVEPHLPAQAPGAQGRALPTVLDKAHVVLAHVDADGLQAAQVQFLGVARVGLQDDLVLGVHLHAVGVLGVAAVVGPVGGLDVAHVPGLGAQDAQRRRRVGRAGAQLFAVGLPDEAAVFGPIAIEAHDDLLKGQGLAHDDSVALSIGTGGRPQALACRRCMKATDLTWRSR